MPLKAVTSNSWDSEKNENDKDFHPDVIMAYIPTFGCMVDVYIYIYLYIWVVLSVQRLINTYINIYIYHALSIYVGEAFCGNQNAARFQLDASGCHDCGKTR